MLTPFEHARVSTRPLPAVRDRRVFVWLLAALYAVLMAASIARLDSDDLRRDATPPRTGPEAATRARALMLGFGESSRQAPEVPLSRQQSIPEGWPLWIDADHEARHEGGPAAATQARD